MTNTSKHCLQGELKDFCHQNKSKFCFGDTPHDRSPDWYSIVRLILGSPILIVVSVIYRDQCIYYLYNVIVYQQLLQHVQ